MYTWPKDVLHCVQRHILIYCVIVCVWNKEVGSKKTFKKKKKKKPCPWVEDASTKEIFHVWTRYLKYHWHNAIVCGDNEDKHYHTIIMEIQRRIHRIYYYSSNYASLVFGLIASPDLSIRVLLRILYTILKCNFHITLSDSTICFDRV